jgi:glucosyl-dolichyl phosphate glucuronosyltransferase
MTSVAMQMREEPIDCELIVVDNCSTDDTRFVAHELINTFSTLPIKYVYEPIPGLLSGRHRGALEARGDVLSFLDDDVELDRNWLSAITQTFLDPSVQLCGGKNLPRYEASPPNWMEHFWCVPPYGGQACVALSLLDIGEQRLDVDATYIWGLNFSIRQKALSDLGGFHPDLLPNHLQHFQGDGETGLCHKANALGFRAVYQPAANVHHYVPVSRMACRYFERRYFYQGVCNSFTAIRSARAVPEFASQGETVDQVIQPSTFSYQILHKCDVAYREGYEFHQRAVRHTPKLLEWVLRPSYWDYQLPSIQLAEELRRPERP